jgi:hypothetical protein
VIFLESLAVIFLEVLALTFLKNLGAIFLENLAETKNKTTFRNKKISDPFS